MEFTKRTFAAKEEEADADLALTRAAFNVLLYRIESREGMLVLPSGDGKTWILPAGSLTAVGFEHRIRSAGRHAVLDIGFRKPGEIRPGVETR